MDIDDTIKKLEELQESSGLLDIKADGNSILEVLAPSYKALFYALTDWKEIELGSLFDGPSFTTTEGTFIEARGVELRYKELYERSELEQPMRNVSFGAKVDRKTAYLTSVPAVAERTLREFCGRDLYLSFCSLFYRDGGNVLRKSPLVFLRVSLTESDGRFFIRCLSDGPIFNEALIRTIRGRYAVDLSYDRYNFDFYNYIAFVSHKISALLWGIDESCFFAPFSLLESNRVAHILNLGQGLLANQCLRSYFADPHPDGRADVLSQIQTALEESSLATVAVRDCTLREEVFREMLFEALRKHKKVLLVGGNDICARTIKEYVLENLVSPYVPFSNRTSLYESFKKISPSQFDLPPTEPEEDEDPIETFRTMEEEKVRLSIPTGESIAEMIVAASSMRESVLHPLDIDLASDYSEDDFVSDRECLDVLEASPSILCAPLFAHPFYGLETVKSDGNYKALKETVEKLDDDLALFFEKARALASASDGFFQIERLRDYDEYQSHFELLSRYGGFPVRYFSFDGDEKLSDLLSACKNSYKVVSSLKLSIENLADNEFFNDDWREVLAAAEAKDRRARKALRSRLKARDRKSLRSLILLLANYYRSLDGLNCLLDDLFAGYEIRANGLDDIIAVEDALTYVDDFIRQVRLYDSVNFSCPFVRRIFEDESYRAEFREHIWPELEDLRFRLDSDFDAYREFSPHDYNDYTDVGYDDLRADLAITKNASYAEFSEYCDFSAKLKDASQHLKDFVNEYSDLGYPMSNAGPDYIFSLYQAVYCQFKEVYGGSAAWAKREQKAMAALAAPDRTKRLGQLAPLFASLKDRAGSAEVGRTTEELKSLYRSTRVFNPSFMVPRYVPLLTDVFPLTMVAADEVYAFDGLKFDLVIVFEAGKLSAAELISSLLLAHEAMIFTDGEEIAEHPIEVGYASVLGKQVFDTLSAVLGTLFEVPNSGAYRPVFDFPLGDDELPLALVRAGQIKPSYVLMPDLIYLTRSSYLNACVGFIPRVIMKGLGLTTIVVNTLELALSTDRGQYLRELIKGQLAQKLRPADPAVRKTPISAPKGDRDKYLQRLTEIYESLPTYPSAEDIEVLLHEKRFDELTELIAPVNSTKLMSFGPEYCQYILERQNQRTVSLKSGFYFLLDGRVTVRKTGASGRVIDDVTSEEVTRAIYLYLTNFSFMNKTDLINELVHVFACSERDPLFEEVFARALGWLLNHGYIVENGERLCLKN